MIRPVGIHIIEACAVLEQLGQPSTYGQIHEHMDGVIRNSTSKYCQRAVGLQLMAVNRSVYPAHYSLVPGWRGNLHAKVHKPRVSSVWDLGMTA